MSHIIWLSCNGFQHGYTELRQVDCKAQIPVQWHKLWSKVLHKFQPVFLFKDRASGCFVFYIIRTKVTSYWMNSCDVYKLYSFLWSCKKNSDIQIFIGLYILNFWPHELRRKEIVWLMLLGTYHKYPSTWYNDLLCTIHARTLRISSCYATVDLLDQDVAVLYLELTTWTHGRATFVLPAEVIEMRIYVVSVYPYNGFRSCFTYWETLGW